MVGILFDKINDSIKAGVGVDTKRAAVHDLTPQSPWYQNVAAANNKLPTTIHNYNFFSAIDVSLEVHFFKWSKNLGSQNFGDGVLLPGGPSDGTNLPAVGGSQFRPFGDDPRHHEYDMSQTIQVDVQSEICFLDKTKCATAVGRDTLMRFVNSPYSHAGLSGLTLVPDGTGDGVKPVKGDDQMNNTSVGVDGCGGAGRVTPENEIFRILDNPVHVCG